MLGMMSMLNVSFSMKRLGVRSVWIGEKLLWYSPVNSFSTVSCEANRQNGVLNSMGAFCGSVKCIVVSFVMGSAWMMLLLAKVVSRSMKTKLML